MPETPPCYVRSWSKAHGVYVCGPTYTGVWGWCRSAEPLPHPKGAHEGPFHVPAHASDAWLVGILNAESITRITISKVNIGGEVSIGARIAFRGDYSQAPTLHAALCRAVTPEESHAC